MREIVFMNEIENTDLNIFQYGRESCTSGHYFGPAVRDHYLIHCISGGKGRFTIEDRSYELGKGQGFLIPPDMVTFYQADFDTPWSYSWVGFNGSSAGAFMKKAGLSAANPIFTFEPEDFLIKYLEELISAQKLGKSRNIQQTDS
ncbi:MAG: hypothetical protein HGA22_04580 [Clostridiales bacterium]|nr:hypothetical protein [Clostridiales bacterium]